ncbi:hypothetical protein EWH99_03465 [Sporolactobacillus sp. THM7-7]|nr:hypothetical protein EWH99_03465 [Sporolactobacillus sp. THM7-7]
MSLIDFFIVIFGIPLIPAGIYFIGKKKVVCLPKQMMDRIQNIRKFSITLGIIVILLGTASILAPLLTGIIGTDFWVLYFMGIVACLMLLLNFLLR